MNYYLTNHQLCVVDENLKIIADVVEMNIDRHKLELNGIMLVLDNEPFNIIKRSSLSLLDCLCLDYCIVLVDDLINKTTNYYGVRRSKSNPERAYIYQFRSLCYDTLVRLNSTGELNFHTFSSVTSYFLYLD